MDQERYSIIFSVRDGQHEIAFRRTAARDDAARTFSDYFGASETRRRIRSCFMSDSHG